MIDDKKDKKFEIEGWRQPLGIVIFFAIIQLFSDDPFLPRPALFAIVVAGGVFWFMASVSPRRPAAAEEVAATLNGERIFRSVWLEIRQFGPGGDLTGAVLDGPFAGRILSSLTDPELLELLEQLDHSDRFSAKALRAWLSHARPHLDVGMPDEAADAEAVPEPESDASAPVMIDEREKHLPPVPQPASMARQKYDRVAEAPPPPRSLDGMSEAQAFAVLGILDTKDAARIRNAYERAVKMAGGEAGGAHETLARLKLARRVLLGEWLSYPHHA